MCIRDRYNTSPFVIDLTEHIKDNKIKLAQYKRFSAYLKFEAYNSPTLTQRFEYLYQEWSEGTKFYSNGDKILAHWALQELISLGEPIIPLVLQKYNEKPNHWTYPLMQITGENPVPEEHHGNLEAMQKDWLAWGEKNGYQTIS